MKDTANLPLNYSTVTVKTIKSKSLNFDEDDPPCKLEDMQSGFALFSSLPPICNPH